MPANPVTADTIRELMETSGPCLTVVGKPGPELANALNALRRTNRPLGPAVEQLIDQALSDSHRAPGPASATAGQIAIFRSASKSFIWRVPDNVKPVAAVGERFHLRSVVAAACAQQPFYILALSQNRSRLLECTQHSAQEVPLPEGTPLSLTDSRQTRKPDHTLDNRNTAGPSVGHMKGVLSGSGTEKEDKEEQILHFFSELDKAVAAALRDSGAPLVIAGVEHELATYKRVNTYPKLVEPGVHGAPDGLEGGEMHRRALEQLRAHAHDPIVQALRDFDKKAGTGHASTHIQEIVAAAYEGRVAFLYAQPDASYMGIYDTVRQRVKHGADALDGAADLVDAAAEETIRHGGEVRVLDAGAMPNGVPVCAIFRYPAAQSSAAVTEAA